MKKRFWALFLAVMMVVSVLPTSAFAEDGKDPLKPEDRYYTFAGENASKENPDITLSKTAVYKGDGTYEVTLSATAEEVIKPKPTKVIFVLDASYSMSACTKTNCSHHAQYGSGCNVTNNSFSDDDSRWMIATSAIAQMKSALGEDGIDYLHVLFGNAGTLTGNDGKNAYGAYPFSTNGYNVQQTYIMSGVNLAVEQAMGDKNELDPDTNYVMIIVSDGAATDGKYSSDALTNFKTQGGKVYAVGFTFSNDQFKGMATDYDHYMNAQDEKDLEDVMETITENIVGLINDPMGSKVDLNEDSVKVSNADMPEATINGTTINWTDSKGLDGIVTLTYEVTIKPSEQKHGTLNVPLNGAAKLNYAYNGEDCSVDFPTPIAIIKAATLDVDYMLGDEQVDNDHEWINLTEGDEFETAIPEVGAEIKIKGNTYWVIAVNGEIPDDPAADAYEVIVSLSDEEPIVEYTITYHDNVADENIEVLEPQTKKHDVDHRLWEMEPERTGYEFLGWNTDPDGEGTSYKAGDTYTGNADLDLYAQWVINTYTVTWVDENDDVLETDEEVPYGATPSYDNDEPTKAADAEYTYTFAGWTPEISEVIGNVTYTATYTETTNKYTVTFVDEDGDTVLKEATEYEYGTKAADIVKPADPTKKADAQYTYTFAGWTPAIADVTADAVYQATYTPTPIPKVTVTFDANGGAWAADVEGYVMNEDDTTASITANKPYTLVEIPVSPVRDGYVFTGWYDAADEQYEVTFVNQKIYVDVTLYAGWEEIQPDDVKYTVRKHYIGADGNEAAAVNLIDQTGKEGAAINTIIANYAKDQTYYGQNYTYAADKTTVEPDVEKLEAGVVIDLYYYLDTWNDEKDSITEGDDIPDMYQAAVEFKAAVNGTVGKDGEKLIQVYTNKENNVVFTPSVVTPVANEGYAFDVWYKDVDFDAPVDPFVETTVAGGTKIVYTATFAKDVIGDDNGGDTIPDKYQAVVTYVVKNGTWDGTDADPKQAVFTLYEKIGGVWTPKTGVTLGDTIPAGMKANATHIQSSGEWDVDIDENTAVTGDATYTYEFKTTKAPSIEVTKTVNKTSAEIGDTLTYTIVVENKGNVDLINVIVTDAWLNKSETIATLAKGESKTFIYTYKVVGADAGKTLKNTVIAKADNLPEEKGDTAETKIKKNDPVKPVGPSKPQLNKADHYAYIVGYPDGLVHPEKNITRAEVATIFFRMLLDESREDFWAQENWFFDVMPTDWFNNAVSTLANANLINGYPDGNYRPNANITRAEFATIAIRFFLEEDVEITENNLSDVKGHWAEANIDLAYALNLINGYPDGTFRPDQQITRAEAMTIVNRVLERAPHKDHLLDDMIEWPDNMDEDIWYYADVQEATNSHEFYKTKEKDEDKTHEIWTELLPVRDWVALEQAWSAANSSKNPGEVVDIDINTP